RKQLEESQKQKRECQRAVQQTLTPRATKSTDAITTVNSKPQSKPLPLPKTTADLMPVPTVAVLSDSTASRIRQDELQSPHATIKLYLQSGATLDKLIEYVHSNDGTQFLSDVRQLHPLSGPIDCYVKHKSATPQSSDEENPDARRDPNGRDFMNKDILTPIMQKKQQVLAARPALLTKKADEQENRENADYDH
ncbi:unnamed protein product, partial [Didymodactylos carnosus]